MTPTRFPLDLMLFSEDGSVVYVAGHRLNRIHVWRSIIDELGLSEVEAPLRGMRTRHVWMRPTIWEDLWAGGRDRTSNSEPLPPPQAADSGWWNECSPDYEGGMAWTRVEWVADEQLTMGPEPPAPLAELDL